MTPAAGYVPPDDTPAIRIGATIFADYTVMTEPKGTDVDGNTFTPNAFNVGRAYINVTGQINHMILFRITPDIVRETGTGSSSAGSYVYRLKYAYAQFNMDDWMSRGSYARFGMQQTPWVDFMETVYRYRFQGTIFEDRESFLSSSDVGATFRYNFKNNYGDVLGGFYNGENYNRAETNDQKAFMIRGTVRPLPMGPPVIRGLRVTGFYDADAYVKNAERKRGIFAAHLRTSLRQRRVRLPVGQRPDTRNQPEAGLQRLLGLGHAEDDERLGSAAPLRPPRARADDGDLERQD